MTSATVSNTASVTGPDVGWGKAPASPPVTHLGIYLAVGVLFGVVITKSEVISWFRIQEMFRFQSFHMYRIIASGVVVAAISLQLIKRMGFRTIDGQPIVVPPKVMGRGTRYWLGGIIFGLGWALVGSCPGPLFALIGNGIGVMFAVLLSAMLGTRVYVRCGRGCRTEPRTHSPFGNDMTRTTNSRPSHMRARPAAFRSAAATSAAIVIVLTAQLAGAQRAVPLAGSASMQEVMRAPAETLFVYGPGGPLPAMKEAATAFEKAHGVAVQVTGGPTPPWLERAHHDADVIFSGAENMMTDYVKLLGDTTGGRGATPGRIDESTIVPLYLRPVAMLVRPGNPKRIRRFEDLLEPGVKILVVQGAGQTGLWEDVAGRTGDIGVVRAFRRNIGAVAGNSGEAKQRWSADKSFDVWLIWNVWQVANPALAEAVPVAERWRIYRDAGVALTMKRRDRTVARDFVAFLQSHDGARIFAKWGWMAERRRK